MNVFLKNREGIKRILDVFFKRFWTFDNKREVSTEILIPLTQIGIHKKNQTYTPGENDHVKENQGRRENKQGNGDN